MATDNTSTAGRTVRMAVPADYDPQHDPTYIEAREEADWLRARLNEAREVLTAVGAVSSTWREQWEHALAVSS